MAKPPSFPKTLWEAHQMLTARMPSREAPSKEWVSFYRSCASVYAEIADIDRGHHHEALYWANDQRDKASTLADKIATYPGVLRGPYEPAVRAATQPKQHP